MHKVGKLLRLVKVDENTHIKEKQLMETQYI